MRCLALAQSYQSRGGEVLFAMAESTPALEKRLGSEGFGMVSLQVSPGSREDAQETVAAAGAHGSSWVIVDGYHFDAEFQRYIREAEQRLMVLDDYGHAERYYADLVLNQNFGAQPGLYAKREAHSRLLLGPRYCLLRKEFWKWRQWERSIPIRAGKILITLGGSDPDNVTGKVLEAVKSAELTEATVIVGGGNPHLDLIRASVSASDSIRIVLDTPNMAELMAAADLAITAGGSTVWETAFMGLPAITIVLAENQQVGSERLQEHGVVKNLGWHASLLPEDITRALETLLEDSRRREKMSRSGRVLVDGLGSFRVWLHLNEHALRLNMAGESHSRLIWEWANQPSIRAVSFSSDPIPWESHVQWLNKRLADPGCHFWIATDNEQRPVGQIRFETTGDQATVSVSLDAAQRGQGLGPLLIWTASQRLFRETSVDSIHAYVKVQNIGSGRAFEKAGYQRVANTIVNQQEALHFEFRRAQAEL